MGIYDVLQSYLDLTEKFLGEKQEAWRQTKEEFLAKKGYTSEDLENGSLGAMVSLWILDLDDDDSDSEVVLSNWSGYPNNIKHEFPNLFRRSFFITAYSIFESGLQNRCKYMEENFKLKESVTDLPGRGIRRSKNYLEKVVGLKISNPKEWHEVLAYNKLRNCFVHNNGYVTKSDDEKFLRDYILKHNFLEIDYDEIVIGKEFCEEAIKNFETFEDYISECFSKWLISSVKP